MKRLLMIISMVILICFTFSCQKQTEEVAEEPAVDVEAEKQVIRDMLKMAFEVEQQKDVDAVMRLGFFAAIDTGDFDKLKELIADDFALNAPGLPEPWGADMLFQAIKAHYTSFPDWTHVIEATLAEGDRVAVKLIQNGTHKAGYEGIPATGIKATLPAMHLVKIVDGKVMEWFAIEDYLGLYMQLGMELKPKEAEK